MTLTRRHFTRQFTASLAGMATFGSMSAFAQGSPSADEILELVRQSYGGENLKLKGVLKRGNQADNFVLSLNPGYVRFDFSNPAQAVQLQLSQNSYQLKESLNGGALKDVPVSKYDQNLRGSDLNYQDISLCYIYWNNPELIGEERVGGQKCWRLRIYAPGKSSKTRGTANQPGAYLCVEVWIHQGSGGLAKMQGYNHQGEMIKQCLVRKVQKINQKWALKEMRVQTHTPGVSKPAGETFLEMANA